MSRELLFEKKLDRSFLLYGTAVPKNVIERIRIGLGLDKIERGTPRSLTINLNGRSFLLSIRQVAFDKERNRNHSEIWRVLWGVRSKDIQSEFRHLFPLAFAFCDGVDAASGGVADDGSAAGEGMSEMRDGESASKRVRIPEAYTGTVSFYYDCEEPDVWYLELQGAPDLRRMPVVNLRDEPLQKIVQGAPGTGKSHLLKLKTQGCETIRTTFHPDSDYATFVGSYRPEKAKDSERITYGFVPQAFTEAYVLAWQKRAKGRDPVFLIIEEINRGNCAQIFGDLFQLLDRRDDGFSCYPIRSNSSLQRYLAESPEAFKELNFDADSRKTIVSSYSEESPDVVADVLSGKLLVLPDNLYIWATMNTSDQSLFPIDSAFKRRWEWQYVPIQDEGEDVKIAIGNTYYKWWSFLDKINAVIGSATHSEDKKLGYYFVKAKAGVVDVDRFVGKVIFYLWNDVFKNYGFDDKCFKVKDGDSERILSIQDFFLKDGKVNVNSIRTFLDNLGVATIAT